MSLFRKLPKLFIQPSTVFIVTVALFVFAGGGALWLASHPAYGRGSAEQEAVPAAKAPGRNTVDEALPEPVRSVSRALLDMANLAYEESLGSPLDDGVKQADFALIQALLRSGLPLEDVAVEKIELRQAPDGAYNFQRLRLYVGDDPLPFVTSLHDSLRAWAENAELAQGAEFSQKRDGGTQDERGVVWTISIGDVVTHELALILAPARALPQTGEARKFTRGREPGSPARLVIVIDDIGEDMRAARKLIDLPFPVTFSVWPHSSNMKKAAEAGHAAGLEILVHQPTEPMKYPEMNPGPRALLVSLSDGEIEKRVRESAALVPHAVGMNNHMGSRFTRDRRAAAAMARPLKDLDFFVLDSVTHPGSVLYAEAKRLDMPALKRDIFLDAVQTKENVLRQLRKAEKIALVTGKAIAIGHPLPETLAGLAEWAFSRNTQVVCVRLSDLLAN